MFTVEEHGALMLVGRSLVADLSISTEASKQARLFQQDLEVTVRACCCKPVTTRYWIDTMAKAHPCGAPSRTSVYVAGTGSTDQALNSQYDGSHD
ncbi:unnamed protein product, partial [Iphiclides podalirius]